MKRRCPFVNDFSAENPSPKSHHTVRIGHYHRATDSRWVQRYRCLTCDRGFSSATVSPKKHQKVRRITPELERLYASGVSQRRLSILLDVNLKTIARRIKFLAGQAKEEQMEYREKLKAIPLESIQFDDLETIEHTKCKPLSVAIAVEPNTRKILGFQVSQMPAKGPLSKIALKKYGPRKDERSQGWNQLLEDLKPHVSETVTITSDENPHYPKHVKKHHPSAIHCRVPGGRGAITGQSELRDKGFDPMFALNHSCAMLRANMNRLFRRTWCTTKKREGLINHLLIYVNFHNKILTKKCPLKGSS